MEKHSISGCRPAQFFGLWAMEQSAYDDLVARAEWIVEAGQLEVVARQSREQAEAEKDQPPYVIENGVARFVMSGPLVRHPSTFKSAFGETATLTFQHAIRKAANDGFVQGIFIEANSPGGTTEGLSDTAAEVARARAKKPIRFHIAGMGASAMYRLAVEGDVITADSMAILGSVGTLTRMRDLSELAKRMGIKEHYVASGDRKAAGAPGTVVTEEQLAERKELVDAINQSFLTAVSSRRRQITKENMADIARAGLYDAHKALSVGLADAVMTTEEAVEQFTQRIPFGSGRTLPGKVPSFF